MVRLILSFILFGLTSFAVPVYSTDRDQEVSEDFSRKASFSSIRYGHYTGLIEREAMVNANMGGRLDFSVTRSGMLSGSLWMDGRRYPFRLAVINHAALTIKRAKSPGLRLSFDSTSGRVSLDNTGDTPSAAIFIYRKAILVAAPDVGSHTVGFTGNKPLAEGFARLLLRRNGSATWIGRAGDGSAFTCGTHITENMDPLAIVPLHARLDKDQGSLQGFMTRHSWTTDIISTSAEMPLDVFLKARDPLKDRTFASGLEPTSVTAVGSRYDRAATLEIFLVRASNPLVSSELVFFGLNETSYPRLFQQNFIVRLPGKVSVPRTGEDNPNGVILRLAPSTGLYSGRFVEKSTGRKGTFFGVLVRNSALKPFGGRGFGQYLMPLDKLEPTHVGTVQWLKTFP